MCVIIELDEKVSLKEMVELGVKDMNTQSRPGVYILIITIGF